MLKKYPLAGRFVLFIIVPLIALSFYGFSWLEKSLPQVSGQTTAVHLSEDISISRDQHGVVYVEALTDRDVFYATGYAHAQDRLWQLELQKRIVSGRLAEVFGRDALSHDVWIRTLGIYESARDAWRHLSPTAKKSLIAYITGINAWIEQHQALPPEFLLLDIKPQRWTAIDSLAWIKMFALNLAGNMNGEIEHYVAAQTLSQSKLQTLYQQYADRLVLDKLVNQPGSKNAPHTEKTLEALADMNTQLTESLGIGGKYVGSNAWVVSGSLTASGKPLLANDPHLGLQIPSLWYAISQKGEQIHTQGMGLPGTPLVIFGKNKHITWGGTNMMADVQDLFFEQLNPAAANQYLDGDEWLEMESREEVIEVKPDFPAMLNKTIKPVTIKVRRTRRGPVISDVVNGISQTVSMSWVALEKGDRSYEAFFRLNYAHNWESFRKALGLLTAPALNMLYADDQGNIGYVGAGKLPVRGRGEGLLPLNGWQPDNQWQSVVPYDDMPVMFNPPEGYIASANDDMMGDDYADFISHAFAPPARITRIKTLLQDKARAGKLTPDDMREIQGDTFSDDVQSILPILKAVKPETAQQQAAIDHIKRWNGDMDKSLQAPAIFHMWMRQLRKSLFNQSFSGFWNQRSKRSVLRGITWNTSIDTVKQALDEPHWCQKPDTAQVTNCHALLVTSLSKALRELDKLLGDDVDDWTWGVVQKTHYGHVPFSDVKVLDKVFERQIGSGGGMHTINVAVAGYSKSEGFVQDFGAGMRQITSPGFDDAVHLYMNSTGQSGHPLSKHYDDMVTPFNQVELQSFATSTDKLNTLVIKPSR